MAPHISDVFNTRTLSLVTKPRKLIFRNNPDTIFCNAYLFLFSIIFLLVSFNYILNSENNNECHNLIMDATF